MNEIINKYINIIKKPKILILVGLLGLLLVLFSNVFATDKTKSEKTNNEFTPEKYKAVLEEDIKKTVKDITGSKNVSVVITLESSIKYSYADIKEETTNG